MRLKYFTKKHFNIDPNTTSPFNIYPEEEKIERYSGKVQIELYAQNEAFWAYLKEDYDDIDELTQMRIPRAHYINRKYMNIRMDAYIKLKHNPKAIKQIPKRVAEILSSRIPQTVIGDCSICLKNIHKNEQKTLECNHTFHKQCIFKWAVKSACKTASGIIECRHSTSNQQILLYNKGENVFNCPCCRVEYTYVQRTSELKRVLAKIHIEDKGKCLIQYITNESDLIAYVPLSEMLNGEMSRKWATMLSVLKCAWERGDNDIYAMIRIHPDPEFILTNKGLKKPPLYIETGLLKGHPIIYRMVEVTEL